MRIIASCLLAALVAAAGPGAAAAQERTYHARGDESYPPYEFINNQGEPDGYNVDMMRAVAEVMGLDVRISLGPWNEVRTQLERGEIDALTGMYYSPERDELVDFSKPFIEVSYAVFVREGAPIKSIHDIAGSDVVVQDGDIGDDYVTRQGQAGQITRVENPAQALRQLAAGKHDCAVLPRLQGLTLVHRYDLNNLVTVGAPFLRRNYCFAVRQGDETLLQLLNEGLSILHNTGRHADINEKWFGVVEQRRTAQKVLRLVGYFLLPLLAALAVVLVWSWSLRRRVDAATGELRQELARREQAQEALRESEEKYRQLVDNAQDPIYILADERIVFANPKALEVTGYSLDELKDTPFTEFLPPEDRQEVLDNYRRRLAGLPAPTNYPIRVVNRHGERLWIQVNQVLITWRGQPATLNIARDITHERRMEQQLRQSQKMEAIGTLAGGIAHDFNNILGAVVGYTELALDQARQGRVASEELEKVLKASAKARDLVRQILTFSRKMGAEMGPVDLNHLTRQALTLLERTIPKMIHIDVKLEPGLRPVMADATQLEQILINLVANAQGAMPEGGQLSLRTQAASLGQEEASAAGLEPGDYVRLTVSDTGHGIAAEDLPRVFDPFFTTKEVGQGTGLGLSTVFGIVKGHGGHIDCTSTPGQGTTFNIWLPALAAHRTAPPESEQQPAYDAGRGQLVLLVDDEPALREIGGTMLSHRGYEVITAASGEEAVRVYEQRGQEIAAVIMDLGMPGMGGRRALRQIIDLDDEAKVIIASGYAGSDGGDGLEGAAGFISKPFRGAELLARLGEVLGHP